MYKDYSLHRFYSGIAIAVSFFVILFTSLNLFISIYSVLTILFIISITVTILIMDGWKLGIFESIIFSVAAGMSADFTLHYSVTYLSSPFKNDRRKRSQYALTLIGPATFMGALTTFVAGENNG